MGVTLPGQMLLRWSKDPSHPGLMASASLGKRSAIGISSKSFRGSSQVVLEMNRLGMLVDLSHVSSDAMRQVLDVTLGKIDLTLLYIDDIIFVFIKLLLYSPILVQEQLAQIQEMFLMMFLRGFLRLVVL